MSISKIFIFFPFLSKPFLKRGFHSLKQCYLILNWNLGLPYFRMELVNFCIPEIEPLFPAIIAANLKRNKFGGKQFCTHMHIYTYTITKSIFLTYPGFTYIQEFDMISDLIWPYILSNFKWDLNILPTLNSTLQISFNIQIIALEIMYLQKKY